MPDAGNGRTMPSLGRLVSVPLREVWPHEASDFTPWLANADNLGLFAETLCLDGLQLQGTEVPVGNFFIDILARDIEGRVVVIENQFGSTDHTHLGQILTYVAGQEGQATVVWIAETIRDEHRATIDWLNATTIEGFDFFTVEIEALRIGTSSPAPRFNIVAKPNNWSRRIMSATRSAGTGRLDDQAKAYIAYWSRFAAFLTDKRAPFKMQTPVARGTWCGFGHISPRGYTLTVSSSLSGPKRGVALFGGHQTALAEFEVLSAIKDEIAADFGASLEWRQNPKSVTVEIVRFDLAGRDEAEQFAWFLDQMERFIGVFRPRIENLPLHIIDKDSGPPQADADE